MFVIPSRTAAHPERTPLSASTAADLVAVLLSPQEETTTRLSERLLRDPIFFLWALAQQDQLSPVSASPQAVAEELLHAAPQSFSLITFAHNGLPEQDLIRWADWCEETSALSHLCRTVEPSEYVAAQVVHQRSRNAPTQCSIPNSGQANAQTDALIQTAVARLSAGDQEDAPVQAAKRFGSQSRKQFLSRSSGDELALASLVGKLLRLERLEDQFSADLEREKLAAMKELAYGASHEINNPLANITTRAQLMLREETDPERRRKLATINSQAFRAHEMIANMMLYAHPPKIEKATVDAARIIDQIIAELSDDAARQGTQIQTQTPPEPLELEADPTLLSASLKALGRNALEALGAGGWVRYQATQSTDAVGRPWCEFSVTDNGPGITPEVRRHLFDPFYSGREAGRGLGFGLSTCWRVSELHGGNVTVAEELEQGAQFTIRLPIDSS